MSGKSTLADASIERAEEFLSASTTELGEMSNRDEYTVIRAIQDVSTALVDDRATSPPQSKAALRIALESLRALLVPKTQTSALETAAEEGFDVHLSVSSEHDSEALARAIATFVGDVFDVEDPIAREVYRGPNFAFLEIAGSGDKVRRVNVALK
jgi:hypothetical protein